MNWSSSWTYRGELAIQLIKRINSLEEEVAYGWNRLLRYDFYEKNGYNLSLPETKMMAKLLTWSRQGSLHQEAEELFRQVIEEDYKSDYYKEGLRALDTMGIDLEDLARTLDIYQEAWGFKPFDTYTIRLTKYGPGGSYDPKKGHIIIKVKEDGIASYRAPSEIILHEIIHIALEQAFVQPFDLNHLEKETLVDAFFMGHFLSYFPDYKIQRQTYHRIDDYIGKDMDWTQLPQVLETYCANKY